MKIAKFNKQKKEIKMLLESSALLRGASSCKGLQPTAASDGPLGQKVIFADGGPDGGPDGRTTGLREIYFA